MQNRTLTKSVSILGLALCLLIGKAEAAGVFMWAVDGTQLVGLDDTGKIVTGATATAATGDDYFSLAVGGTTNSQNIFVADSANNALYEYHWNGATLTENTTVFKFAADSSGGGISPQEIALSGSNLWTTSFDGQIEEYVNPTTSCTVASPCSGTTILPSGSAVAGARGIMITGGTAYVTIDGPVGSSTGSGYVDTFSASGTANPSVTTYASTGAATTGGTHPQQTGQMRGIAMDSAGNLYYVDSTWGNPESDNGYVCEVTKGTAAGSTCTYSQAILTGLDGPNELISGEGDGSSGTGSAYDSGCNVLYLANFYAGTITEINTGLQLSNGSTSGCGSFTSKTFLSSSNSTLTEVSGLSLAPSEGEIGGDSENDGPVNLFGSDFEDVNDAPEPGTWVLAVTALLSGIGLQLWRRRRAAQA